MEKEIKNYRNFSRQLRIFLFVLPVVLEITQHEQKNIQYHSQFLYKKELNKIMKNTLVVRKFNLYGIVSPFVMVSRQKFIPCGARALIIN